jgi:nitrate/nitrite transporter NarK
MAFAWKFLRESAELAGKHLAQKPRASRTALAYVITHAREPGPRLIWIYAIGMGAFSGMNAILALFLMDRFGITERRIWIFFTYIGTISVVTRAGVLGWAVDKFGEAQLSRIGLVLLSTGLFAFPFVHNYALLAIAIACIPLGTAFTFPCVTSLLSRVIPKNERGLYMGVQQAYGGMARVIVPLWAGFSYDHFGKSIPFITSSLLVLGSLFLNFGIDDGRKVKTPPDVMGEVAV